MDRIRESMAAKTSAFILIVLCIAILVLSGIVIAVNTENRWYSEDKTEVYEDFGYQLAVDANYSIIDSIYYGYAEIQDTVISDDAELIQGEAEAESLGYIIKSRDKSVSFGSEEKPTKERTVNSELIKSGEAVKYDFVHDNLKIQVYLNVDNLEELPAELRNKYLMGMNIFKYRNAAIAAAVASFIAAIICFVFLIAAAGHSKKRTEGNYMTLTDKVPVEVFAAAAVIVSVCAVALVSAINGDNAVMVALLTVCIASASAVWLGFIVAAAIKLKHNTFKESSIICRLIIWVMAVLKWILRKIIFILKGVPLVWKSTLILMAGVLINLFIVMMVNDSYYYSGAGLFLWFIGAALTLAAGIYSALCMKKLRDAAHHLAEGDLEYQVDKKGLFLVLAKHADDLNSIGKGMAGAVEEKMKSERFKTELITNVSHDIKTPLTSIINYVDLLSREDINNDKAEEYIEVLQRQSTKLKKLVEDLVEASKAASGAVTMNMESCQVGVLMEQVTGEYKERAEEAGLELISRVPDDKTEILADGRSLWRVFDNVMNNICKYSQPGTRVYQILEKKDDKAVITYKNTSKYELDITADELMERFVRGDKSRSTEGSGLGLSIAKNLTELQGGSFDISIDGDLFKVVMKFRLQ
ncbi:MAG: HAMP domain-containing sensor histidine kinase [Bacillota bacterium]|nr:HAMP domain-containing sensor histidine kinase [Bacillota bacterium]